MKLAQLMEELTAVDAERSAQKLLEAEAFLLSILSTQGKTAPSPDDALTDINRAPNDEPTKTIIGYRSLCPVVEALIGTGSNGLGTVKQAFEKGAFKDPRLYKIAVDALGGECAEIVDYVENTVLPSMGAGVYPFLLDGYSVEGGAADGRRLAVMHAIEGESMLGLVDEASENGSAELKIEAVKIMANYPRYEARLLVMLGESESVRENTMKALIKINSKTGIDKMMKMYKSDEADAVIEAITCGESSYLTEELLKTAYADYVTRD
jgi:hypothetical protein